MDDKALQREKERREFAEWMKERRAELPELAERVFAKRKTNYTGCGFGWAMEKRLGAHIKAVCDYDNFPLEWFEQLIIKLVYEDLIKDLERIEGELNAS